MINIENISIETCTLAVLHENVHECVERVKMINPLAVIYNVIEAENEPDLKFLVFLWPGRSYSAFKEQLRLTSLDGIAQRILCHYIYNGNVRTSLVSLGEDETQIQFPKLEELLTQQAFPRDNNHVVTVATYPTNGLFAVPAHVNIVIQVNNTLENMAIRESKTPLFVAALHRNGYWVSGESYSQLIDILKSDTAPNDPLLQDVAWLLFFHTKSFYGIVNPTHASVARMITIMKMTVGAPSIATIHEMYNDVARWCFFDDFITGLKGYTPTKDMVEDILKSQGMDIGFTGTVPLLTDEFIGQHPTPPNGVLMKDIMK